MAKTRVLVLTCEHAGNNIPARYKKLFKGADAVLKTHRGLDIGALTLAKHLKKKLRAPLFFNDISRLVVDNNRSITNRTLFSEFTRNLSSDEHEHILASYYFPHRDAVELHMKGLVKKGYQVLHIGVHSFTPVLNDKKRSCGIGLLYDPHRITEIDFARDWQRSLSKMGPFKVKRNYPYWGHKDGFVTHLRRTFKTSDYIGIELEINQALLQRARTASAIADLMTMSLKNYDSIRSGL